MRARIRCQNKWTDCEGNRDNEPIEFNILIPQGYDLIGLGWGWYLNFFCVLSFEIYLFYGCNTTPCMDP